MVFDKTGGNGDTILRGLMRIRRRAEPYAEAQRAFDGKARCEMRRLQEYHAANCGRPIARPCARNERSPLDLDLPERASSRLGRKDRIIAIAALWSPCGYRRVHDMANVAAAESHLFLFALNRPLL